MTTVRSAARHALVVLDCIVALGCAAKEVHPRDHAREVRAAEESLTVAMFDTVAWKSDSARLLEGNSVYAGSCARCHGYLGDGATPYAMERQLDVPSLVAVVTKYDGDLEGLRRRVFSGHEGGMPTWGRRGAAGLTPREVDAVSFYVLRELREPARPRPRGARR